MGFPAGRRSSFLRPSGPIRLTACSNARAAASPCGCGCSSATAPFISRTGYCLEVGRWRLPIPHLLTPGRCPCRAQRRRQWLVPLHHEFRHQLFGETYFQEGLFHQTEAMP